MGNRISISFVKKTKEDEDESVTLFSHWDGKDLLNRAKEYLAELKQEQSEQGNPYFNPIDRLEPNTVMVDFIRHITKDEKRIENNLYLGKNEMDGDNSDNGHFKIKV